MSAEFDVLKALALAGDVTAAQSLTPAARKELERAACSHGTYIQLARHGEPYLPRERKPGSLATSATFTTTEVSMQMAWTS